jgi:FkbM family methyltransferase
MILPSAVGKVFAERAKSARRVARAVVRTEPSRSATRRLAHIIGTLARRLDGVPASEEFSVRVGPQQSFRYLAAPGDVIGRHLYWGGLRHWEGETWQVFLPRARAARTFVDIGAFTGAYTLVACAANPRIECLAFEPVPHVFRRMCDNLQLNEWTDRVTTVNAAVSGAEGRERFWLPDRPFPDTGHLATSARIDHEREGKWVEIPTTTLSAALPAGFTVDLMKIDVEDAEGPIVASMADVLARDRPTIIVEMLASGSYEHAAHVLLELEYSFYHLTANGPVRVDRPAPRPQDLRMNFLCLPRGDYL